MNYFLKPSSNKGSILFWPGGMHGDKYLVCGEVNTIQTDTEGMNLFKEFSKALTKGFKKIDRYYVGPEAMEKQTCKAHYDQCYFSDRIRFKD